MFLVFGAMAVSNPSHFWFHYPPYALSGIGMIVILVALREMLL